MDGARTPLEIIKIRLNCILRSQAEIIQHFWIDAYAWEDWYSILQMKAFDWIFFGVNTVDDFTQAAKSFSECITIFFMSDIYLKTQFNLMVVFLGKFSFLVRSVFLHSIRPSIRLCHHFHLRSWVENKASTGSDLSQSKNVLLNRKWWQQFNSLPPRFFCRIVYFVHLSAITFLQYFYGKQIKKSQWKQPRRQIKNVHKSSEVWEEKSENGRKLKKKPKKINDAVILIEKLAANKMRRQLKTLKSGGSVLKKKWASVKGRNEIANILMKFVEVKINWAPFSASHKQCTFFVRSISS